jgi:hypothetical protein
MPVQFKQTLTVRTTEGDDVQIVNEEIKQVVRVKTVEGHFAFIDKKEPIISSTDVQFQCDNPACPVPQVLSWNQEQTAADNDLLPDGLWRTAKLELFDGTQLAFCGIKCLVTHAKTLTPLRSPREQRLSSKVVSISDGTGYNGGGDE